ncbi:MAG: hypothetical protein ACRELY_26825 [Polyangiaceae bacterium]
MAGKRKLPLISSRPDDQDPPRPPLHWVGFGVVAIFALWLPLAALAEACKRRAIVEYIGDRSGEIDTELALASLDPTEHARLSMWIFGLPICALALASLGGGYLIGRYGGAAGHREGALAAALAAFVAAAFASLAGGMTLAILLPVFLAAPFGALGAWLGKKKRA